MAFSLQLLQNESKKCRKTYYRQYTDGKRKQKRLEIKIALLRHRTML